MRRQRIGWLLASMLALCLLAVPMISSADVQDSRVVEGDLVLTSEGGPSSAPPVLLVQATSWLGDPYRYIVTLSNLSQWPIDYLSVLDRYFPADPDQEELYYEWFPERLEPGISASVVISYTEGPLPDACHQLEMNWSGGWSAFLIDCSAPPATTLWQIPLTETMAVFLPEPEPARVPTGPSKLGIHVTRNSSPAIMQFVAEAQPAVVAAVGDLGWLSEVKQVSPRTVTVGRLEEGDQAIIGDPVQRAQAFVQAHAAEYLANPGVDYWLGWNEPGITNSWEMAWYAAFEAERARAMADLGLKVAIGNFSTGTPEADLFAAFLPAIEATRALSGVLALHEYSAPTLLAGVGAGIPGLAAESDRGALTLRYRYWYEHFLLPLGLDIPLIITEAGIDGGVLRRDDVTIGGWRDLTGDLPDDLPRLDLAGYLDQLSWYDDQLRSDPYVIGFAVFNCGDPDGRWASFDLTDELDSLAVLVRNKSF